MGLVRVFETFYVHVHYIAALPGPMYVYSLSESFAPVAYCGTPTVLCGLHFWPLAVKV